MTTFQLRAAGSKGAVDKSEVRRALTVLVDPRHWVEIRGVSPPQSARGIVRPGSDLEGLCAAADELSYHNGVYYCLNPIREGSERARASTVVSRRNFLVDIDPVKEDAEASATDDEKEATQDAAIRVIDFLAEFGWPAPISIDSGNGSHLIYRIDLPNSDHARQLLKAVLQRLAGLFNTDHVEIDTSVHDAPRISKLPGTWARKGQHSKERPHRQCRLLFVPDPLEIVPAEAISRVCTEKPEEREQRQAQTCLRVQASAGGVAAYGRAALANELAKLRTAAPRTRNNTLNRSAFSLGQLVGGGVLQELEVQGALHTEAVLIGLTDAESRATIRSGMNAGKEKPRGVPEKPEVKERKAREKAAIESGERIIIRGSEIETRPVEWLWPGRIPLCKLTTFAGQTSQGKTFVTCDIMARITTGNEWPHGPGGECAPQGQVLFISGDDDPDDTIVPRLMEAGADITRVVFLTEKVQANWSMAALKTLDEAIRQAQHCDKGKVLLVVVDPPTSFMAGVDDHKNTELRSLLTPLKDWAKQQHVAVVLITHVNKGGAAKTEAMMRVMGGVAWVTGVRVAYMFAPDPDDETRQLWVPLKNNLAPKGKGLAYRIAGGTDRVGRVEWLGEVEMTADEALGKERRPRQILATEWLIERFREKLEWSSDDFWRSAREHNVSKNAINEARVKLNMPKPRKTVSLGGDDTWVWWVPPDWPPLHEGREAKDEEAFAETVKLPAIHTPSG